MGVSRRQALRLGAVTAGGLLVPAFPVFADSGWAVDLRREEVPSWLNFRRGSPGSLSGALGELESVAADRPRWVSGPEGRRLGLLVEGRSANPLPPASSNVPGWRARQQVKIVAAPEFSGPGREGVVLRIHRPEAKPGSEASCEVPGSADWRGCVGSVWLRSVSGKGGWPLGLIDGSRGSRSRTVVALDERWRRVSVCLWPQATHLGLKRFAVLLNTPPSRYPAPVNWGAENDGESLPLLDEALFWGAQVERGLAASSWMPAGSAAREADELWLPGSRLRAEEGSLSFHLPNGGSRNAVLIEGPASAEFYLGYTPSGMLEARIGGLALRSTLADLGARSVRLDWGGNGLRLSAAGPGEPLIERAARPEAPAALAFSGSLRIGASQDGTRSLNQVLGAVEFQPGVSAAPTARSLAVSFAIPRHQLSFEDHFNDPGVERINEQASGGREGAPAWRSRYRHERSRLINGEKQIYVDPAYAGSGPAALGLQPFSIRDSVLSIRAQALEPAVSEQLWGARYASGCITSEFTHWQTYGYFEMRARLPLGRGFWPAFWLLPKRVAWPPEIDVLEGSGARPFGVHCGVIEKPRGVPDGAHGQWIDGLVDTTDGFHVYALEWRPDDLLFFVDGQRVFRKGAHYIHEDLYLLVNLALGSKDPNWIPDPDQSTDFSQTLQVDYVRAFRRSH